MKRIFTFILILSCITTFAQQKADSSFEKKKKKSTNSFFNDYVDEIKNKPVAIFVNEIFIGNGEVASTINSDKIKSIKIEKEPFVENGIEYFGKMFVELRRGYKPRLISLEKLIKKKVPLDEKSVLYQIDGKVISPDYMNFLVDENYILKVTKETAKLSKKDNEINIINIITKNPENIKKSKEIRFKGTKL
ncbi:hypothetical protein [Aureivirga sp. CE67]|uniref:hypothetical protein n=1 Tax=Aureivirga sp. CE67 TaxID=1788983 RepID=UPI0018C99829|nr:hypothetical protein [Aureivirga sp. CE67]